MVVDLDLFQANIRHMADTAKANGINVRPHVKVHKSVDVAKHQVAHGAIGLTCATIAEAELFSGAGIDGVLWTKQPASVNNIERAVLLSKKDPTFMFVADDPQVVDWVEEAAAAHDAKLRIAVSVYAGMARQGIDGGQPALELAQKIDSAKRMKFEGFMAYSGGAAHTKGFENRRKHSLEVLAGARESRDLAKKAGLPVNIMTGGSTGTYNIDHETGLSELEAGSYVFMDTEYFIVGGKDGDDRMYNDFKAAMTVLTTVDGKTRPNIVTTDYGAKALAKATDQVVGKPWYGGQYRGPNTARCAGRMASRSRSWATASKSTAPTWTRAPTPSTATTSPRATRLWTCGRSWAAAAPPSGNRPRSFHVEPPFRRPCRHSCASWYAGTKAGMAS